MTMRPSLAVPRVPPIPRPSQGSRTHGDHEPTGITNPRGSRDDGGWRKGWAHFHAPLRIGNGSVSPMKIASMRLLVSGIRCTDRRCTRSRTHRDPSRSCGVSCVTKPCVAGLSLPPTASRLQPDAVRTGASSSPDGGFLVAVGFQTGESCRPVSPFSPWVREPFREGWHD